MDWTKLGAIGSFGSFLVGAVLFFVQVWPLPQIRAARQPVAIATPLLGMRAIGIFLIIGFLLAALAIYGSWRKADRLHWTMTQDQEEVIYGKTFRNETIEIDGKKFDHCMFENVTLMYHGLAPTDFVEATWTGNLFLRTDNDAAKGFTQLSEQLRQTFAHLPNITYGVASVDKNGNIVPLPVPLVKVNK